VKLTNRFRSAPHKATIWRGLLHPDGLKELRRKRRHTKKKPENNRVRVSGKEVCVFDAIVVGGRCAGAATALLLARKGYRVLIVDKARFPADIPHGHFIHRQGPGLLQRWGVLDQIVRSGCPPVTTMTTDFGDFPLTGRNLASDGVALGYGPRRRVLDAALLDVAVASGAEFRDRFSVDEYLVDGAAVTGIRGRSHRNAAHVRERARIVVGADGRNSSLARAAGAEQYEEGPPLTCWYFSYWSGAPISGLEIYLRGRNTIFVFPTNDGLTAVFVAWEVSEFARVRQDIAASFMNVLARAPELEERIRDGRREERFYGAADLPNFFRKPYGPGWALVGDAGHHKDPYLALGISDALRDADLLAFAIDEGFSGRQPLLDALATYEHKRNAAAMPLYHENLTLAQFEPPSEDILAIRAAIRGNQEETNKFYLARQGMIPPEEFFGSDANRISAGATRTGSN
jgi:2-polyprenyl-6-methoxyphenol hydroxylase-like FAD-dependent oxidoreductase